MKKQYIDYTFKDVCDKKTGDSWFSYSENTVRETINNIENNYFQGRRIYHGITNSKNNAIVFRFEIKGLLLLLLKLELQDIFRDNKFKDNGISNGNIDKIVETYRDVLKNVSLSDYEYRVLMNVADIKNEFDFYNSISEFKRTLSRFFIIIATKYHDHPSDYYKMAIKRINDISISMIYGSNDLAFLNKFLFLQPLDLRKAVIRAINKICEDLYYFDDNKLCKRRFMLELNSKVPFKENHTIYSKFYEIRKKHLSSKVISKYDMEEIYNKEEFLSKYEDDEWFMSSLEIYLFFRMLNAIVLSTN